MTKKELLDNLGELALETMSGEFQAGVGFAIGYIAQHLFYPEKIENHVAYEDEKDSEGFWDLAAECALSVAFKMKEQYEDNDNFINELSEMLSGAVYAEEWGQEAIYNILTSALTPERVDIENK